MLSKFLLAASLAGVLGTAPQALAATINIRGGGNCEEWTEARTKGTDGFDRAWLLGYLSGLASAKKTFDFWGDRQRSPDSQNSFLDNEKAFRWIDAYCRDNPRDRVTTAAADLFDARQREVTGQ